MIRIILAIILIISGGIMIEKFIEKDVHIAELEKQLEIEKNSKKLIEFKLQQAKFFVKLFSGFDIEEPFISKHVNITCYTSRKEETDVTPLHAANMSLVKPGSIAVSQDLKHLVGKEVLVKGFGIFVVSDVMNSRYKRRIDIWSGNWQQAKEFGVQEGLLIYQGD
jgi:3D (Asp-Asp-Asp) domain-containing protein